MTIAARVFLGQGGGNSLFQMDSDAIDDDGVAYDILGSSVPIAPAGIGGEAVFYAAWLAVTHSMAVVLRFRFFVDDEELDYQDVTLDAVDPEETIILEFALGKSILGPTGAPAVVNAARGSIFVMTVESVGGLDNGTLIVEGRELEMEVVRESRSAEG